MLNRMKWVLFVLVSLVLLLLVFTCSGCQSGPTYNVKVTQEGINGPIVSTVELGGRL